MSTLLDRYNFAAPRGHLDQGIVAHARGGWAAANAQLRTFIESLYNSISTRLAAGAGFRLKGFSGRYGWQTETRHSSFRN